jgi:pyruvate,water dikinase
MNTPIIKALADIRAADAGFSGGKGANLGELLAAGLSVPDGFVIGVAAYQEAVAAGLPVTPSDEVRDAIVASYRALGPDVAVAVRSSALAEDGATASHAGIYETALNVTGVEQLLDAVRDCWTSASAPRARQYGRTQGLGSAESGMGVVVQRQICASCAGVAFTIDPLTGCRDRLVLESVQGLGQAVVSGTVTPDRVVVDKNSLEILTIERGQWNMVQLSLSENQIREIAQDALAIERWYGRPQDIEWALDGPGKIWILQARPVTTFDALQARAKAVEFYDPPRPPGSRWTRVNIGEALPGVPTPLTWSMWSAGLTMAQRESQIRLGVVARREDGRVPLLTLARGWPVLSVDLLLSQVAQVPGVDPKAFSEQLFGAADDVDAAPLGARVATALRMTARAPIALGMLNRRLRRVSAISRRAWQREVPAPAVDPLALLAGAAARFGETLAVHTMQTYLCQSLYQAVERFAGSQVIDLLSGDGDLPEAHLARDLWLLAGGRISLEHFISEHGFHGPEEGEIASASWRQDPEPVLHAAQAWVDGDRLRDRVAALEARRDERRRAEAALCASVPRPCRRAVARLIAMARRALVGREIGKAAFLQDLDVARHAVAFLGGDAVWHTLSELQSNVHLPSADITARQRIRSQYATLEPPLSFAGDPGEQSCGTVEGVPSIITGVGASPGCARGRARVVTEPASAVVLGADEVLVAHTTDPSWVMTFMTVAGMAIDVGGTLSHAAIIARELGIPCVIGTGNGTRAIPDGALVEIDGSQGTVQILGAPTTDRPGSA